jgi:hypothetical protein
MIISYQYLVHGLGNLFLLYLVMPGNAGPVVSVGITPPVGRLANDTFAQRTGTKVVIPARRVASRKPQASSEKRKAKSGAGAWCAT